MLTTTKSRFIISLDFELFWGVRDKRSIAEYGLNVLGVRQVIPALLDLFDRYGIHASFATVGFLFARDKEELLAYQPRELPAYSLSKYSPYENNYLDRIGFSEIDDPYHYGESLIKMIQQSSVHEIASHTFSHYYCLENASLASFEADIIAAKKIATGYGIELKSMVFPRNQYSQQHIEIIKKLGFTSYRGNEQSYLYKPRANEDQNKKIKALRLADSYTNITGHHTFSLNKQHDNEVINIPASRFLRPFSSSFRGLNWLRLKRIKNSLSYAAKKGEGYHLWWHPHNFGINLKENLASLEDILKHYKKLNTEYGMQSESMKEIAEALQPVYAK